MVRPLLGIRIDRDVYDLLDRLAPTPKSKGELVSRLLYEHEAKLFQRRSFREQGLLKEEKLAALLSKKNIAV